jgi:putative ABC transport system permease protein
VSLRARAYRALLHAYPPAFRDRFGPAMEQALRDRYHAAASGPAVARLALRTLADTVVNATLLRLSEREKTRMRWQSIWMDARYALRMFARNPLFTLLGVTALALGIGANAAIFSIVNGVLLQPLPYAEPDRLVMVWSTNSVEHRDRDVVAPLDFLDFRKASSFTELHAAYSFLVGASLALPSGTEQITVSAVTPGTFEMLGRAPARGRLFTETDTDNGVIVSYGFWQRRLGGDPGVIGRVLTIADRPRTIVGVMPDGFVFPYKTMLGPSGFTRATDVDGWLPLAFVNADTRATGEAMLSRSVRFLSVFGRLRPGVTVAQADAEVQGIARGLASQYPASNAVVGASVVGMHEQTVGPMRPPLALLLGGVGFVLLMACVNLANLILARSSARQRELSVRAALGAGRGRLLRQTLTETLILSLGGGALAMAALRIGMHGLIAIAPGDMPRLDEIHTGPAVLVFTLALSVVTGLAIGLVPGLAASRSAVRGPLRDSARGTTAGRGQRRLRAALVIAEVALAVVLTAGAGLLLRSFVSVLAIDPGFTTDHLLTLQIALPRTYVTADEQRALYARLFSRLEAIPGVVSTGGTTRLPLGSTNLTTKVDVEGRNLPPGERPEIEFRRAVHHYFSAMGIPILRGRGFTAEDGPDAPPVAVVNERMASRLLPGADPIGRRIRLSNSSPWITIVGVIGDIRHSTLEAEPEPEMYIWYLQGPPVNPFIVVRSSVEAPAIASAVRAAVQEIDRSIAAYDIRPMTQVRAASVAERRFVLRLVAAFGALALVMAAVGVYGVMALIVAERRAEIGIRLALGAAPGAVLRGVLGEGLWLTGAGIAAGLAAAAAVVPLLASQLYGVRPLDPITLVSVALLLMVIAAAACVVPARRAMSVDPVSALRV